MKFTTTLLLLAAACHAADVKSAKSKQKVEERTDKRTLLEGNLDKRAPLLPTVSPSITPGIEYADVDAKNVPSEKSPSQQYVTPIPQISKISDVLTSQGPFQAAIANHLYSPISVYQSRLAPPTTYQISPPVPSQLAYTEHRVSLPQNLYKRPSYQHLIQYQPSLDQNIGNYQFQQLGQPINYQSQQLPQPLNSNYPVQLSQPQFVGHTQLQPVQPASYKQELVVGNSLDKEPKSIGNKFQEQQQKAYQNLQTKESAISFASLSLNEPQPAVKQQAPQQQIQEQTYKQAQVQYQPQQIQQPQVRVQYQPQPIPQQPPPQLQYQFQPFPQQPLPQFQYQPQLIQEAQPFEYPVRSQQYPQPLVQYQAIQNQLQPQYPIQQIPPQLQYRQYQQAFPQPIPYQPQPYPYEPQLQYQPIVQPFQGIPPQFQPRQPPQFHQFQQIPPQIQPQVQQLQYPEAVKASTGKLSYLRPLPQYQETQNQAQKSQTALPTQPPVQYFGKYAQSIFGQKH